MENGIFISYRRKYKHFAGRIHDYLANKGIDPYMDVYRMKQGYYEEELRQKILDCPYFLLVLSGDCLDNLQESEVYYKEIELAFENKGPQEILIVSDEDFVFPDEDALPLKIRSLPKRQCDVIRHEYFVDDMNKLIRNNIQNDRIVEAINWRERIAGNSNTLADSRSNIENMYATMANRFGKDLIDAVNAGKHYDGIQMIKHIRMSCYAASLVFNSSRNMVDDKAYDNGLLFNTFAELLRDKEFSMEIIINAPDSTGAKQAVENLMLGNSALEQYPEAVFYSAYAGLNRLIEEVEAFKVAHSEKRFRYYLVDTVMNGAIFQMEYKPEWKEFDHIKYDMYGYDLSSAVERRCLLFFRENDPNNYEFMSNQYRYLKRKAFKLSEVAKKNEEWMQTWEEIKEEL